MTTKSTLIGGKHWEQNVQMVNKIWLLLVVAAYLIFVFVFFPALNINGLFQYLITVITLIPPATRGRF